MCIGGVLSGQQVREEVVSLIGSMATAMEGARNPPNHPGPGRRSNRAARDEPQPQQLGTCIRAYAAMFTFPPASQSLRGHQILPDSQEILYPCL